MRQPHFNPPVVAVGLTQLKTIDRLHAIVNRIQTMWQMVLFLVQTSMVVLLTT